MPTPAWRPQSSLHLRSRPAWLLFVGYLALALLLAHPTLLHGGHRFVGLTGDSQGFAWWLSWVLHWVLHGGNLLHPGLTNVPSGLSALWSSSVLGLDLPALPLTAAFGPTLTYNFLIVLGLAATASVMSLAAGRFVSAPAAAFVGLLGGFSPFLVTQAEDHLNYVWFIYPPLILLLAIDLCRGLPRRRFAAYVSLATFWQYFISSENLLLTAVWIAVLIVSVLVFVPSIRLRYEELFRGALLAGVLSFLLLVVPVLLAYSTATRKFLPPRSASGYSANLEHLVVPTQTSLLGGSLTTLHSSSLDSIENGFFVGIGVLIAIVILLATSPRRGLVRSLSLTAIVSTVLALGPTLQVFSHNTGVWLPWRLLGGGIFGEALPVRLAGCISFTIALLLGIAIDQWRSLPRRRGRDVLLGVLGIIVFCSWLPRTIPTSPISVPVFFTNGASRVLPDGANVLVLPTSATLVFMAKYNPAIWQVDSTFRFRVFATFWANRTTLPDHLMLVVNSPSSTHNQDVLAPFCATLRADRVTDIVVALATPNGASRIDRLREATGIRPRLDAGVALFELPSSGCPSHPGSRG